MVIDVHYYDSELVGNELQRHHMRISNTCLPRTSFYFDTPLRAMNHHLLYIFAILLYGRYFEFYLPGILDRYAWDTKDSARILTECQHHPCFIQFGFDKYIPTIRQRVLRLLQA